MYDMLRKGMQFQDNTDTLWQAVGKPTTQGVKARYISGPHGISKRKWVTFVPAVTFRNVVITVKAR